ncbi:MAG: MerR family transcriptional regulator [Lachnospiraceae bacterium]|nr:MerR family transcriptional regulator [Lachnospiraceae bacterium]
MELQTISQVSKDYGISARMLRYYEQVGLIESLRKDDYMQFKLLRFSGKI